MIWPYVRSARRAASHLLPFHSHGDRSVPPSDLVHGILGRLGFDAGLGMDRGMAVLRWVGAKGEGMEWITHV